jgi:hypothetical protein
MSLSAELLASHSPLGLNFTELTACKSKTNSRTQHGERWLGDSTQKKNSQYRKNRNSSERYKYMLQFLPNNYPFLS